MNANLPTALLVEDDMLIALMISEALRGEGIRVIEAPTAEQAILIVTAGGFPIDVLLTDVQFPRGPDGFEFARWFRGRHPSSKIFVTSGASGHIKDSGANLLAATDTFVPKPYDVASLASHLGVVARDEHGRRATIDLSSEYHS